MEYQSRKNWKENRVFLRARSYAYPRKEEKAGDERQSDGHGINVCNRCVVGDGGSVGPVERAGSYWTHVFECIPVFCLLIYLILKLFYKIDR